MSRYEPRLRPLSVLRRDPVISQIIEWNYGPNFGDRTSMSVMVSGDTFSINERGEIVFDCPLDRARLLHEAIGNVIYAADGGDRDE